MNQENAYSKSCKVKILLKRKVRDRVQSSMSKKRKSLTIFHRPRPLPPKRKLEKIPNKGWYLTFGLKSQLEMLENTVIIYAHVGLFMFSPRPDDFTMFKIPRDAI